MKRSGISPFRGVGRRQFAQVANVTRSTLYTLHCKAFAVVSDAEDLWRNLICAPACHVLDDDGRVDPRLLENAS